MFQISVSSPITCSKIENGDLYVRLRIAESTYIIIIECPRYQEMK